jgi:hypothetical protein
VLFAFIVLGIGAIAAGGSSTDTTKPQQTTTAPAPKQTSAQPQQQSPVVGKPYDAGDWLVTVNGVSTSQGGEFDQPKAGHHYLIVHVTEKNTSGQVQTASSMLFWSVKDSTGQTYTQTFISHAKAAPDGKVADGSVISGDLVYEVPVDQHNFTVQFTPDFGNTLVEWQVNV